ncbi:hypothetical protein RUM44_010098 [Polyplax serrata]|uniref:Uncharacterized protein n=1 Tax=Polyplax serrata TaxID=468196 RepID=A0ABR1AUL5_POLSC
MPKFNSNPFKGGEGFLLLIMEDCRESLDGESVSGDADEVSSNLDIVELESRPSSSSTLFANATTTTQQIAALPSPQVSRVLSRKETIHIIGE